MFDNKAKFQPKQGTNSINNPSGQSKLQNKEPSVTHRKTIVITVNFCLKNPAPYHHPRRVLFLLVGAFGCLSFSGLAPAPVLGLEVIVVSFGVAVLSLGVARISLGVAVLSFGVVLPVGVLVFSSGVIVPSFGVAALPVRALVFPLGVAALPVGALVFSLGVAVLSLGVTVLCLGVPVLSTFAVTVILRSPEATWAQDSVVGFAHERSVQGCADMLMPPFAIVRTPGLDGGLTGALEVHMRELGCFAACALDTLAILLTAVGFTMRVPAAVAGLTGCFFATRTGFHPPPIPIFSLSEYPPQPPLSSSSDG